MIRCEKNIVIGWGLVGNNWVEKDRKRHPEPRKKGLKIVFSGVQGRGVLRFSGGGIQESRS